MSFDVEIGHFSVKGPRETNEDFAASVQPAPHDEARGLVAAIADGVSTGGHGLEAAQTTVMSVVQDYFACPDTWDTTVVLDRLIGAQNAWLADHNRRRQGAGKQGSAAMTTVTALVLRGHAFTLAHVGDTRAWLLRGGELVQLTQDHAFDHPDLHPSNRPCRTQRRPRSSQSDRLEPAAQPRFPGAMAGRDRILRRF